MGRISPKSSKLFGLGNIILLRPLCPALAVLWLFAAVARFGTSRSFPNNVIYGRVCQKRTNCVRLAPCKAPEHATIFRSGQFRYGHIG